MLFFKNFEHIDDFDGEKIMWIDVDVFGVPKEIKKAAQQIDKENYDETCFGVCIIYNYQIPELYFCEDKPECILFYTDNNGLKHWFFYHLSDIERYGFFSKCIEEMQK